MNIFARSKLQRFFLLMKSRFPERSKLKGLVKCHNTIEPAHCHLLTVKYTFFYLLAIFDSNLFTSCLQFPFCSKFKLRSFCFSVKWLFSTIEKNFSKSIRNEECLTRKETLNRMKKNAKSNKSLLFRKFLQFTQQQEKVSKNFPSSKMWITLKITDKSSTFLFDFVLRILKSKCKHTPSLPFTMSLVPSQIPYLQIDSSQFKAALETSAWNLFFSFNSFHFILLVYIDDLLLFKIPIELLSFTFSEQRILEDATEEIWLFQVELATVKCICLLKP